MALIHFYYRRNVKTTDPALYNPVYRDTGIISFGANLPALLGDKTSILLKATDRNEFKVALVMTLVNIYPLVKRAISPARAKIFNHPKKDESKWKIVHNYLTKARGLPENFLNKLRSNGWLYADNQQNAVFTMRSLPNEAPHHH